MLDNNKALGKNATKTLFVQRKLLSAIDADLYLDFRSKIILTNMNPRPKIKLKSTLNSFQLTMICLEKLKSLLNFFKLVFKQKLNLFGSVYFD